MLNGQSANLPTDTIIESGVVFKGAAAVGVTVGGVKFDPGKETRQIAFDGQRSGFAGGDRIVSYKPKLSFTMIEFGGSTSGNQIGLVEQAATSTTHKLGTVKTTIPKTAGDMFAAGDYHADLRVVFERAGGGYAAIRLPLAFCSKYDLAGQANNEGKINAEFEGRLSAADAIATPGKAPYEIELRTALPS